MIIGVELPQMRQDLWSDDACVVIYKCPMNELKEEGES